MSSKLHVTIYDSYVYDKARYCSKQVWQENTGWWIASLEMGREIGGKSKKKKAGKKWMMRKEHQRALDMRRKEGKKRDVKMVKG